MFRDQEDKEEIDFFFFTCLWVSVTVSNDNTKNLITLVLSSVKGHPILGKDRWFQAHRTLMVLTVTFTAVGLVLALIYTQGWQYSWAFIQ